MTGMEIILLSSIVILCIDLVRTEKRVLKINKELVDLRRKNISTDRDIKTLHLNQKVLQSTIKELHRDLKIYGEVKKSKVRFLSETPEEE